MEGKALEQTKTSGFDDCLRFEVYTVIGEARRCSRTVACAGIGTVERDDAIPTARVFQHLDVLTSGTTRFTD